MKKIISLLLAAAVALCLPFALAGCGSSAYPVDVANIKIENEPQSIVVLDANAADMIAYMGLDGKIVGRSDQVDQASLAAAPSFGACTNPDVTKIKSSGATVVFATDTMNRSTVESLENDGIKVVRLSIADTPKQLKTNYKTLGKILCGKTDGDSAGELAFKKLTDELDSVSAKIPAATSGTEDTICYLYYESNKLKMLTRDTYGEMLLEYTKCANIAGQINEPAVDVQVIAYASPKYIIYSDETALNAIKADPVLSKLSAVRTGSVLQVSEKEMKRQGITAVATLQKIIDFMLNNKTATPDQPAQQATQAQQQATQPNQQATQAQQQATQPNQQATQAQQQATQPNQQATQAQQQATQAANSTSVAAQYKLDDAKLARVNLKPKDENGYVKVMQLRLFHLGYIGERENVTGYYGEVTEEAVRSFQEKNGINATGAADSATLVKMFDKSAQKAG